MPDTTALQWIDAHAEELVDKSRRIWCNPEPSLKEYRSAEILVEALTQAGFEVKTGVAGMPTAFVARYAKGKGPIVGFLGEYDALPELSQAAEPVRKPLVDGGYGHGCGHNLLGVGSLGAAMAVKAAMEAGKVGGEVRFYGCPAEEQLVGKVFMARDGLFDDLDLAVTWHPSAHNGIASGRNLAMNSARFHFYGVSAHAAVSPESGRSALDAVELMNVGANYLREHISSHARIHYVITNGGIQPNVVPSYSQVWYYVRAPRREEVEEIYAWVLDIAKGAALMAGVRHEVEFVAGCYDTLRLETLLALSQRCLERVGAPRFTPEEKAFARELAKTHEPGARRKYLANVGADIPDDEPLCEIVVPDSGRRGIASGSTDVGDVSWIVPTAELLTACWPIGNAGHSWQNTASAGTSIGFKGMLTAAKGMALVALECMQNADLLLQAKVEFLARTSSNPYRCPIPPEVKPDVEKGA